MTYLLTEAFQKAQNLPEEIQNELAHQLIEDIENELKWQNTITQSQTSFLDELARKALNESKIGETKVMGFDEL